MSLSDMNDLFNVGLTFLLGLCVGSFTNVVIIRLPRGRSLVSPSSRCGFCRSKISLGMNIPLFGFLISGGSCRSCGHPYSSRYFWVEALMGVLSIGLWSVYGWSPLYFILLAFVANLIALAFIDLELKIIPDALSLGGWGLAVALAGLGISGFPLGGNFFGEPGALSSFYSSLIASLVGFGMFGGLSAIYRFVRKEDGLGGGDIKLMGLIGAVLGLSGILTTILVGSIVALIVGIIGMSFWGRSKYYAIPFGPSLVLGALVSVFQLDKIFWP